MIALFAAIIIVVIILYCLRPKTSREGGSGNGWKIYGTMGCGWTRKQLDHMKKAGKPFSFVDCDNGNCDGVDAFPTLVSPSGEKHVGYKEV